MRAARDRREVSERAHGELADEAPVTLGEMLSSLIEAGLEADEAEHGLVGYLDGTTVTVEEHERRRPERERRLTDWGSRRSEGDA